MIILETKHLKKYYENQEYIVKALDDVSIKIEKGSFVAIVGSSGSGKSTFLNLVGALDKPDSGEIMIDGINISSLKGKALVLFRRKYLGFIFQNYNLIPVLNGYDNIALPVTFDHGHKTDHSYGYSQRKISGHV